MADIVRDLYDEDKQQDKVIFQQKKPICNYELNLAQDILKYRGIELTHKGIGNNYSGNALKVYPSNLNNEFWVTAGTFYHLGRPIKLYQDFRITGLTTPTSNRIDTVFIEWYLEEIDATDDPTIVDTVLGFETARQERLNVEIKISEGSDVPIPSSSGPNGETIYYFPIAKFNRISGNAAVTAGMISDERDKVVYNFVTEGCDIADAGGLDVSVAEGNVFVGDTEFYIEDTTPDVTLAPSSTNYVYVEKVSGFVTTNTTQPNDYHVMLAEVTTDASSITQITDRRLFKPIAWNYKYGEGGEGETGYPTLTLKFRASEDIATYDAVYLSGSGTIGKATASSSALLPTIGISPQAITTGQIDNIVVFGEIANPGWSWTPGNVVFLDTTSGQLTQTAPTVAETYVQRIGMAVTSAKLFVNPDLVYIKNNTTEINLVSLRPDGNLEVINNKDKFDSSRISDLAAIVTDPISTSFEVLEGSYFVNDTEYGFYPGATVDLTTGGYQTSAITSTWYNKAGFTLREDNTLQMYESVAASTSGAVSDPELPDNELPITILTFQDDGTGAPGTINSIEEADILDIRNWLNLGNLDNTAFKPVYRTHNTYIMQKGGAWFNSNYLSFANNLNLTATTAVDTLYHIYLDYHNATGAVNSSSFVTMSSTPTQVDQRRYIPLGKYNISGGQIVRSSFEAFKTRFWHFRDAPYLNEQDFSVTALLGQATFNITNFTFLSTDFLEVYINGDRYFEGASKDYVKTAPNTVTFNFTVKKGAKVTIRKV